MEKPFRSRSEYCLKEDIQIVKYLQKVNGWKHINGNKIWQIMVDKQIVPHRSFQSLRNRFLKNIKHRLHRDFSHVLNEGKSAVKQKTEDKTIRKVVTQRRVCTPDKWIVAQSNDEDEEGELSKNLDDKEKENQQNKSCVGPKQKKKLFNDNVQLSDADSPATEFHKSRLKNTEPAVEEDCNKTDSLCSQLTPCSVVLERVPEEILSSTSKQVSSPLTGIGTPEKSCQNSPHSKNVSPSLLCSVNVQFQVRTNGTEKDSQETNVVQENGNSEDIFGVPSNSMSPSTIAECQPESSQKVAPATSKRKRKLNPSISRIRTMARQIAQLQRQNRLQRKKNRRIIQFVISQLQKKDKSVSPKKIIDDIKSIEECRVAKNSLLANMFQSFSDQDREAIVKNLKRNFY